MTKEQEKVARQIRNLWPNAEIKQDDSAGPGNYHVIVPGKVGDVSKHFPHPLFGVGIYPACEGFVQIDF